MGDSGKLQQVIINLLNNAIEATRSGGGISITTSYSNAHVDIEVSDAGAGIPEEYMPMVFDPFFTTKDGGTGLGLSICYNIIEQHNGTIDISSIVGKGTTVKISLPVNGRL